MLNYKQIKAYEAMIEGHNVFITGAGGTGKSYLINKFIDYLKTLDTLDDEYAITSTTGLSSMLIGGQTINSFAGIGLVDNTFEYYYEKIKKNYYKKKKWTKTRILIIDEISMLSPRTFELLDALGRKIRYVNKPFGGIQLILLGDFCQLPTVGDKCFCFEAFNWDDCIDKTFYLDEIVRQKDDLFQNILNKIRLGICDNDVKKVLSSRLNKNLNDSIMEKNGIIPTILYSRKIAVNKYNKKKEKELLDNKNQFYQYQCCYKYSKNCSKSSKNFLKDMIDKNSRIKDKLILVLHSQVMINVNMSDLELVNGSRGIIVGFSECEHHYPIVRFLDGREIKITEHEWKIENDNKNWVKKFQIPLKLAWALTIHKSQGMSLDYVCTDIGNSIFEYGQVYVVLSRVRNLEGLVINSIDFSRIKAHPKVIRYYGELKG